MGRNHKRVIMETLKLAQDNGLQVKFNNFSDGAWLKDYATAVTIDGKSMNGLQAWDNKTFDFFMNVLQQYASHEIELKDIEPIMKGSKTSSTRHQGHVEYAKDSYHWSQIDLLDKWHAYCESLMDADYENATDITIDDFREGLKQFLLNAMKKTVQCNPCMRGWSAERLEDCYITHGILPRFIKEQLKIDLKKEDLQEIQKAYLSRNPELFNDCLHRLSNDTMVKDDLFFTMGYTQEGI